MNAHNHVVYLTEKMVKKYRLPNGETFRKYSLLDGEKNSIVEENILENAVFIKREKCRLV